MIDLSTFARTVAQGTLHTLADGATEQAKKLLKRWSLVNGVSRLTRVEIVKPIWNPGKEANLQEFYFPCPVKVGTKKTRISDLSDLAAQRVVITGRVGQGKSILLRFVASNELRSFIAGDANARIPLFLEMRHFGASGSIREHAIEALTELGLQCDEQLFEHLAGRKRLALLLDGFDEMPVKRREKTILDLERLGARYENLIVVVTSRPNVNGIEQVAGFATRRLLDLDKVTRAGVIRKQYQPGSLAIADRLIRELEKRELGRLVTTPLMSILLVIHFNTYQKLPEKLGDFHEDLFDALLRRHDATKPGFVRPRASLMDDFTFRRWFAHFAFHSMKSEVASWTRHEMLKIANLAIPVRGIAAGADTVLDDAVNITGLVIEEGGEYRFLHKSIMEYHAASCVKELSDKNAKRFYLAMHSTDKWRWWDEVIQFLTLMDRTRYLRYFELAQLRGVLDSPSLHTILSDCNAIFSAPQRTIIVPRTTWLLGAAGRHSLNLMDAVGEFYRSHAGEFEYDEYGENQLLDSDLARCEDDDAVAPKLRALLDWCERQHGQVQREIERLDDAEELLDMGYE